MIIGIDTGVKTGIAVYAPTTSSFFLIKTTDIIEAMDIVQEYHDRGILQFVRVEDARLRKWFKKEENLQHKAEGAGSVKRDASIWETFLKKRKIPYMMVSPKNNKTKLNADVFKSITGYKEATSEHARDAAMLVFGYKFDDVVKIRQKLCTK
jgi:hypothetical protein